MYFCFSAFGRSFRPLFVALTIIFYTGIASGSISGELDNTFQPSLVKENQAIGNALLIQPDGKIIYAGFFLTINRKPLSYVARFNADGTVDPSFDTAGTFGFDASISALALQPDGKIIVAGSFDKISGSTRFSIARLNPDGSFDPTFNVAFPARVFSVTSVAVQADGKVLLGGDFSSIGGQNRNGFARVNADGSLDTAFNTPCFASSNRAIAIQPDAKILVASTCSAAASTGVSRLNTNGTLDTSFDAGTGANGSAVRTLALLSDGKVLIGGQFSTFNGQARAGIVRVNDNGSVDASFVPASNYSTAAIAVQPDGKVLVSRQSGFQGAVPVHRLNTDGSNDGSFNASQNQVNNINAIAVSADGNVYEAGRMLIDGPNFSTILKPILRLSPAGLIDPAFDPYIVYPSLSAGINNVVIQPDGKILAAGQFSEVNRLARQALVRFNADGSLDTGFTVDTAAGLVDGTINALALQPDGKILIGSSIPTSTTNRLVRLNANGSRDNTFSVTLDTGDVKFLGLQPDGKIVVGGTFTVIGGQTRNAHLARLDTNGAVDAYNPTFNAPLINILSLLVRPDGKFLITGPFTTVDGTARNGTARFNANGTLDATFANTDYFNVPTFAGLQPDGKIIVLRNGTIMRANADNTLDASFTATSFRLTNGNVGTILSAVVQANGKIVVGGQFDASNMAGFPVRSNLARLNTDGSLDAGFGTYGGATGGNVNKIAIQADGRIVIAGVFKMVNGFGHSGLARLNAAIFQANRYSDFDGDGLTDVSVFRGGRWYVNPSSGTMSTPIYGLEFGFATDSIAPGDYDGDGKTDVAVWREGEPGAQANFYILESSTGTVRIDAFGLTGDRLNVGDWDGDGKADVATYREGVQSYFFYRGSLDPTRTVNYLPWGTTGDKPARGDFDGDGKLDTAVFRAAEGVWYVRNSSTGQIAYSRFGLATDKLVPGDFDGDGKSDIAIVRGGVWYIVGSSDGQVRYRRWGLDSDILTPGDYDGDGKTDVGVYRNGVNYVQYSSSSASIYQPFGLAGDLPVASAYVR